MSRSIAFCSDHSNPFYEAVLTGVRAALEAEPDLNLMSWLGSYRFPLAALDYLKPEGLLVGPVTEEQTRGFPSDAPAVGFSNSLEIKPVPSVVNDDVEVGRQAAAALLDAGYERLAVLSVSGNRHTRDRTRGVEDLARGRGVACSVGDFHLRKPGADETFQDVWRENRDRFLEFLSELPPNTGLVATGQNLANDALDVLREELGRSVPGEFGLVLADLPAQPDGMLAHVKLDGGEIGRRALTWLREALDGSPRTASDLERVPPQGVERGASLRPDEASELHARLQAWCLERLREPVSVEDMCREAGLSRRSLEMKLNARGLPAPYELLTGLRLREAKRLLRETGLRMEEIAEACGFSDARQFRKRFQAVEGVPPTAWRKEDLSPRV